MNYEQQAEIARVMTGSTLSTSDIIRQVLETKQTEKEKVCSKVYQMVKENNLPFDKAFPLVKNGFQEIANQHGMDPAVLFWVYMDWLKENNIQHQ